MSPSAKTFTIAGSDVVLGKTALGLMMMTWTATPPPDEQCFDAIKAGVDALPAGAKLLINSASFYSPTYSDANLQLLARFFTKYPEYAERTFLSVKGGGGSNGKPDASAENLRRSVDGVIASLQGTKKLDLFECARVDASVPIEETMKTLSGFVKEGKFSYIGLSEVRADTLKRAYAIHPIAAVEIEISPFVFEDEAKKVVELAKELNVAVVAYSPLGKGLLTGEITKPEDIPAGDMRRNMSRFKEDEFKHNLLLAQAMSKVAEAKGVSPAQLSLAWVSSLGPHVIPLPGSTRAKRVIENSMGGSLDLSAEDLKTIDDVRQKNPAAGDRYWGAAVPMQLWG